MPNKLPEGVGTALACGWCSEGGAEPWAESLSLGRPGAPPSLPQDGARIVFHWTRCGHSDVLRRGVLPLPTPPSASSPCRSW